MQNCKNCNTPVADTARYCDQCGQATELKSFGIWNATHSFFDQYIALEGTAWRTLRKLVTEPGELSITYMEGQRASFVGPIRLFFSTSFVFILLMSLMLENSLALKTYYSDLLFSGQETVVFELLQSAFVILVTLTLSYAALVWLVKAIHHINFGNALLISLHFHSFSMLLILLASLLFWFTSGAGQAAAEWFVVAALTVYMAIMLWRVIQYSSKQHSVVKIVLVLGIMALYLFFYVGFMRGFVEGFFSRGV